MNYYQIPPPPVLAKYVRFFWVLEGEPGRGETYIHRSVADGSAEMIFHYQGLFNTLTGPSVPSEFRAGIDGQSSKFRRYETGGQFGIFGAYLFPFAVPALLGHSASVISNQMPDLASLLGQEGKDLEEQVMLAADNKKRAAILSGFLYQRLQKNEQPAPSIFSSISYIINTRGVVNVDTLAADVCLSTRQFERRFKEYAGFSPKLYSRIIRFQAAISAFGNHYKTLTEVAYECGYYDQSHFIHDFKEFSGYHPRHYFKGDTESTRWKEKQDK
ncbi:helix-turn-helix domain-containing protein [Terrimonas sp. NA20]|uniref:Helix-turn-helix domain-containing protein n=1 Tax=Terrimonas ginsenosidimutans TaxID=2908004 RepID=A0ABS9KY90_9BACT|nr:helix-turn-helix domain-containing protein [Terrimonas ginsenosidimutans]MCG2617339.1 helix-turn-helix domain-containing protein [Terrimonas ginsenosidimutans]